MVDVLLSSIARSDPSHEARHSGQTLASACLKRAAKNLVLRDTTPIFAPFVSSGQGSRLPISSRLTAGGTVSCHPVRDGGGDLR